MRTQHKLFEAYDPYLYDLIHRGHAGDVELYRSACNGARSVLELGCGSGRIAMQLARDGLDVLGIDCHEGMLKRLEKNWRAFGFADDKLRWLRGDMADSRPLGAAAEAPVGDERDTIVETGAGKVTVFDPGFQTRLRRGLS